MVIAAMCLIFMPLLWICHLCLLYAQHPKSSSLTGIYLAFLKLMNIASIMQQQTWEKLVYRGKNWFTGDFRMMAVERGCCGTAQEQRCLRQLGSLT